MNPKFQIFVPTGPDQKSFAMSGELAGKAITRPHQLGIQAHRSRLAQRPNESWPAILSSLPLADRLNSPLPTMANYIPAMPGRMRSSAISPIGQLEGVGLAVGDQATGNLSA
jgi:hypothetical protein